MTASTPTSQSQEPPKSASDANSHAAAAEEHHQDHSVIDRNFFRFFRFGAIDNSLLIISLCVGFSLDSIIAKRVGAKGYGVLIGASIGNCLSDGIAALPEGRNASIGAVAGSCLPLLPALGAMFLKFPMTGNTKTGLAAASIAMLASSLFIGKYFDDNDEIEAEGVFPNYERGSRIMEERDHESL